MADSHSNPTERQKEIVAAYQSGLDRDKVCRMFHCGHKKFMAALAACGVSVRRPGCPPEKNPHLKPKEVYEKLAADYLDGRTVEEVASLNACSTKPVYY